MSVDISQLTARLDPPRQKAIKQQYEERATSPTVAFLLCFFLGSAGAHRFYLREWRVAFAHLALFAVGVVALVAGLVQTLPLTTELANHPVGAGLDALGVALLLAALIWEIIDLGRIDHQVYQRNLLLAEGIIAGTLLADHTVVDQALERLGSTSQRAHELAQAAAAPAAEAGVITASEVADARKLAEENAGFSSISYAEVSRFDISADPDQARQASADVAREGNWTTSATTVDEAPGATPDAAPTPVAETVIRTHTEDGPHVTDSYEVDRVAGPSALEAAGLSAAELGASALGAGLAAHDATNDTMQPAGFDEPTQPDIAASAAPEPTAEAAAYPAYQSYDDYDADHYELDDVGDVTDAQLPAVVAPAADIAVAHASPAYIQLPEEQTAQAVAYTPEAYAPYETYASDEPSAPVYLIPEEPVADAYSYAAEPVAAESDDFAPASQEPSADAYVPPVASVYSAPAEAPAPPTPSWEQPAASTEPQPASQPTHDETLAELAGIAGLAGAGAFVGEELAHSHNAPEPASVAETIPESAPESAPEPVAAQPAPEPVAATSVAPEPPKMKRVRVRRKVVVDGQVVAEEVIEREVPAEMDTAQAAAQIQAELARYSPEEIAQRAHLSPDEEVELRQRLEGPGGAH